MSRRNNQSKKGLTLRCNKCKNYYCLEDLAKEAEIKNRKNMYCPHCSQKIGEVN